MKNAMDKLKTVNRMKNAILWAIHGDRWARGIAKDKWHGDRYDVDPLQRALELNTRSST